MKKFYSPILQQIKKSEFRPENPIVDYTRKGHLLRSGMANGMHRLLD